MEANILLVAKLCLSMLIGGVIGLERQQRHKAAGLRTHVLVCLTSTFLMTSTLYFYGINADTTRVIQAIITGIGFLGAGTILSKHGHVLGLTTAASVWCVAGLGIVVGLGEYFTAIIVTVLVLILLKSKKIERMIAGA